jgi:hypothetical protein
VKRPISKGQKKNDWMAICGGVCFGGFLNVGHPHGTGLYHGSECFTMNGESDRFPPHDKRIKPAFNAKTGLQELIIGGRVVYAFRSEAEFRDFSILVHCIEWPLEKTETP